MDDEPRPMGFGHSYATTTKPVKHSKEVVADVASEFQTLLQEVTVAEHDQEVELHLMHELKEHLVNLGKELGEIKQLSDKRQMLFSHLYTDHMKQPETISQGKPFLIIKQLQQLDTEIAHRAGALSKELIDIRAEEHVLVKKAKLEKNEMSQVVHISQVMEKRLHIMTTFLKNSQNDLHRLQEHFIQLGQTQ